LFSRFSPAAYLSRVNAFTLPKDQRRNWVHSSEMGSVWPYIRAHIAALPSKGHDTTRAECRDYQKDQELNGRFELANDLHFQG
jgi:hypothetical protein